MSKSLCERMATIRKQTRITPDSRTYRTPEWAIRADLADSPLARAVQAALSVEAPKGEFCRECGYRNETHAYDCPLYV